MLGTEMKAFTKNLIHKIEEGDFNYNGIRSEEDNS